MCHLVPIEGGVDAVDWLDTKALEREADGGGGVKGESGVIETSGSDDLGECAERARMQALPARQRRRQRRYRR